MCVCSSFPDADTKVCVCVCVFEIRKCVCVCVFYFVFCVRMCACLVISLCVYQKTNVNMKTVGTSADGNGTNTTPLRSSTHQSNVFLFNEDWELRTRMGHPCGLWSDTLGQQCERGNAILSGQPTQPVGERDCSPQVDPPNLSVCVFECNTE